MQSIIYRVGLAVTLCGLALMCPPSVLGNVLVGLLGLILLGRELWSLGQAWQARRSLLPMDQATVVRLRSGTVVFAAVGHRLTSRFMVS